MKSHTIQDRISAGQAAIQMVLNFGREDFARRPLISQDSNNLWLASVINAAYESDYLASHPSAYIQRVRDSKKLRSWQAQTDISVHPVSYKLIAAENELGEKAQGDNFFVAGANAKLRNQDAAKNFLDKNEALGAQGMVMVISGVDFYVLDQFLYVLEKRLNGNNNDYSPILLDQSDPSVAAMISALQLGIYNGVYGIYISGGLNDTKNKLNKRAFNNKQRRIEYSRAPFEVDSGKVHILESTNNGRKRWQDYTLLETQACKPVGASFIGDFLGVLRNAEEDGKSGAANAHKKTGEAILALGNLPEDVLSEITENSGLPKNRDFIVMADDRAFEFNLPGNFWAAPELQRFIKSNTLTDGQPTFPDAEMSEVTKVAGLIDVWNALDKYYTRMGVAEENRRVKIRCIKSLTSLRGNDQTVSVMGTQEYLVRTIGRLNPNIREHELEDLLSWPGCPELSIAQDTDQGLIKGHVGQAVSGVLSVLGVPTRKLSKLELVHPQYTGVVRQVTDKDLVINKTTTHASRSDEFTALSLVPRFNLQKPRDVLNWLKSANAFVLQPLQPAQTLEEKTKALWTLLTLVESKSLSDPYVKGKSVVVHNPNGAWGPILNIFNDLYRKGVAKSQLSSLVEVVGKEEQISQAVKDGFGPNEIVEKLTLKQQNDADADCPIMPRMHGFTVAHYCGAQTKDPAQLAQSYELNKRLIQAGAVIIDGGGAQGSMGEAPKAIAQTMDDVKNPDTVRTQYMGVQTRVAAMEGDPIEKETHGLNIVDTPTMFHRIDTIVGNADMHVCDGGGIGSLREITTAIINNTFFGKNDPIIILNTQIEHMGRRQGLLDVFVNLFSEQEMKTLNMHVYTEIDSLIEHVLIEKQKFDRQHKNQLKIG